MPMFILLVLLTACGGGGLYTTTSAETSLTTGTTKVFHFGSDYPAGLVIPDLENLRSTAFVVSIDNPPGVVAIDLDSDPLALSTTFHTCRAPIGSGIPTGALVVLSVTRLLFLTSSHLIDCDPSTGLVRSATTLLETIALPQPYPLSRPYDADGDGAIDTSVQTIPLSFPGGLAVLNDRLYISYSNYVLPIGEPVAAAGIVRAYALHEQAPFVQPVATPLVTSAFNPTALRALTDGRLLIVNSGINAIEEGHTAPRTEAGINLYDPRTGQLQWIALGPVALAFAPPAVTADGGRAFVTSASYGEMYQIDLTIPEVIHGHDDPITITSNAMGADFLTQAIFDTTGAHLFVASFQHSAIYTATVQGIVTTVATAPIVVGHAGGVSAENPSGSTTGVGAIAARPGLRDIDFHGPALIALTAFPGKLIAVEEKSPTPAGPSDVAPPTTTDAPPFTPPAGGASPETMPSTGVAPGSSPSSSTTAAPAPEATPCGAQAFANAVVSFLPGPGAGYGSSHYPTNVLGPPHGGTATVPYVSPTELLSLGCGGSIILELQDCPIADGPGADFIVFENVFQYGKNSLFAEPAVVGVSYYGNAFAEFPCTPQAASAYAGCAGGHPTLSSADNGIDPTDPAQAGGDAFDLAVVAVSKARFVRIRDVSCTNGGSPTAGFDLDAVSVVWGF